MILHPAEFDTTFTVSYESSDHPGMFGRFDEVTADQLGAVVAVVARTRGQTVYVTPTGYPLPRRSVVVDEVAA